MGTDRLSFAPDSPLFSSRVNQYGNDLERLGEYLKSLTRLMRQFCKEVKTTALAGDALGIHMRNGMGSSEHAQFLPVVRKFGEIMSEVAASQEILAESLERSFVVPLETFCSSDIAAVQTLQQAYQQQREQGDTALQRYLQSDTANFGRGTTQQQIEQRAYDIVLHRRRFEATRFDLVQKINQVEARKSFELAESCVAGMYALRTHHRLCMERLLSSESAMEELQLRQQAERARYEELMRPIERKRRDVLTVLDAMVERVEIATPVLQQPDFSERASIDESRDDSTPPPFQSAQMFTSSTNSLRNLSRMSVSWGQQMIGSLTTRPPAARRSTYEESPIKNELFMSCEDCEAKMKALDGSELWPFYVINAEEEPAGVIKQGYLWKRSNKHKMIEQWKRRWFVLDETKLYYIIENSPDSAHQVETVCDLMLASVREVKKQEFPFCFEVAFANVGTTMLQAEGQKEYTAWITALRNGIEKRLTGENPNARPVYVEGKPLELARQMPKTVSQRKRDEMVSTINDILDRNRSCAECDRDNPDWISLNLGCVMCIDCSGVHRSLGVHVSKVRSLALDDLEREEYLMLREIGNGISNSIWEANVDSSKPSLNATYAQRDKYIRRKYLEKVFLSPPIQEYDAAYWEEKMQMHVINGSLPGVLNCLAHGVIVEETTHLHFAAAHGYLLLVVLLTLNGADITWTNEDQDTAIDVARRAGHEDIVKYLETRWEQQQKANDAKRNTRSNSSAPPVLIVDKEDNEEESSKMGPHDIVIE